MRIYKDIKKYQNYIIYAVKAGLKAEVAGSYLNWIWWVLEPFCFMIIYATVFGMIFETAEEYFPVYIFVGNAIWAFFSKCIAASVSLVKQNETIISKVYVPKYILLLVEMGINGFKLLLNFAIIAIMLIVFRISISWYILILPFILLAFFLVTFGIGTVLEHYGVYIEDLSYVVSILLNMLMYFSGVFYSVEDRLDYPIGIIVGNINPVAFLMTSVRNVVMYNKAPNFGVLLIWFVIGGVVSWAGINKMYKNENDYAKIV